MENCMIEEPDQSPYEQPRDEPEQHPEGVQIFLGMFLPLKTHTICATGFGGKVSADDMQEIPCTFADMASAARWAGFSVHGQRIAPENWYEFGNQPPVYRPYNPEITSRFYSEDHPEVFNA